MQLHQAPRRKQAGFSVIEVLLVVLVVVVLAATGFVVYQRHQTNSAKDRAAANTTQTNTQPQNTTSTQPAQTTTQYLTIKEWGVRAPYSGSLKLIYTMSADSRTATFSSDELTALSTDCTGRGGSITRWASTDQVSEGPADASTPTAASYFAQAAPSTYAHIGNYYYTFAHDQAACGDLNTTAALQSQTNDAVKALVANLQAIPN